MFGRHPDAETLAAYANGALDARATTRVVQHVTICDRCRRTIGTERDLLAAARTLSTVRPPTALLDRALDRRAAGERVILPTQPAHATSHYDPTWRRRIGAAATVILVAAGALLLRAPEAIATASELTFSPKRPQPGEAITVMYRPAPDLAGEREVLLRAHLRSRHSPQRASEYLYYQPDFSYATVARLTRAADGTFRGEFTLPDSIVFAAFALERADAAVVDANNGKNWPLVFEENGRPSFDGLMQHAMEYMNENSLMILEAARLMRREYPERPVAWMMEMAAESWSAGSAEMPELERQWRVRYSDLQRSVASIRSLSGDDLAAMMYMAGNAGDEEAGEAWKQRLIRERPGHGVAMSARAAEAVDPDLRARLETHERIWLQAEADRDDPSAYGPLSLDEKEAFVGSTITMAGRSGTPAELERWLQRADALGPHVRTSTARRIANVNTLKTEAVARLRVAIDGLRQPSPARRRLGRTAAEQDAMDRVTAARLIGTLGSLLLRTGDAEEAVTELRRGAAIAPIPATLRPLANALLATGDTAQALTTWAGLMADPALDSPAMLDTVRTRAGRHFDEAAFRTRIETARRDLARHASERSTVRLVRPGTELVSADGDRTTFGAVRDGEEVVVVFWSRYCPPAVEQVPALAAMARDMAATGVRTILITGDQPGEEFRKFLDDRSIALPVYHDVTGEMQRAIGNIGTPISYLIDRGGGSRWSPSAPYSLQLQLLALRTADQAAQR